MKKVKFNPLNFGKQNTPPIVNAIGNAALTAGAIGAAVLALPAAGIALPAVLITYATYAVVGGTVAKTFTKCFGHHEVEESK